MANPPLILIVDDDPNFREIFSAKLSAIGYIVEVASGGKESIKKARDLKPDLILMDVDMPEMNGVEVLIKLKENAATENIPVLFLTALGDPRAEVQDINRRLSREVGAIGYLKKGEDINATASYIQHFLSLVP
ncbi:MAG: response regulator [Candidatus Liptonbacteria bacterium]|nr:response regulator [Candidatus Liptonbacteria bacterium]